MIILNTFLDFLCNSAFKNIDLTPGIPKGRFQHPQDVVDKDSKPDDNKNTTNIQKERGGEKTFFKEVAKMVTYIVGAFGSNRVGEIPEGQDQVGGYTWGPQLWTKKDEPSSGGYFTLEDPKSEKLLTAVNESAFALRGMFLLLKERVEKWLIFTNFFLEFSVN